MSDLTCNITLEPELAVNIELNAVGATTYTLPTATALIKGGVKIGSRLTMTGEVLSADVQGSTYTLPVATGAILGGVKDGDRITIAADGTISADVQTTDISGLVISPAANTADYIPQWNGVNSKTLKDGLAVPAGGLAGLTALGGKQDTLVSATNIKTINSTSLLGSGDIILATAMQIWTALTGVYASASTFTFIGTATDVNLIQFSLFTCTSSDGNTRRIGYVKSSVNNAGTITVTVVTDSNLAAGDINFKVAYNRKVDDYIHLISIPGEVIADASYSQGTWRQNLRADSYLLPVDFSVLTAAVGAGAVCTMNVYKNTTALFSSAPDLTTNTVLVEQRPTTNTLSAGENISLRIMSSAGATNKAADFQAKLYIIPTLIYIAF